MKQICGIFYSMNKYFKITQNTLQVSDTQHTAIGNLITAIESLIDFNGTLKRDNYNVI